MDTSDGAIEATILPVSLADSRPAQIVIPKEFDDLSVYLRDETGMHRIVISDRNISRDDFVRANPKFVERLPITPARKKRPWEKEILVIGSGVGIGAAIGPAADGQKGTRAGTLSGGIAGLIYDVATRNR